MKKPIFLIKKRGKYMKGHGYASGFGYKFTWTNDISAARKFEEMDGPADSLAQLSGGKIVTHANKKAR